MEVKIGVQYAPRELVVETEEKADALADSIEKAVKAGGILRLSDRLGRQVIVPVEKLGYVEIVGHEKGQVGFAVD
ncbi:DUF3107 domain-containing protein [Haloglycomyces albus]|uniref:DUF3107 domain-containing protein n=1 Tax=Haloglycomyces albus TaxID=526067 RepID=UPI00046D82C5|nr:DUF3107 domain-containing protein [Haloglycomyces albus]